MASPPPALLNPSAATPFRRAAVPFFAILAGQTIGDLVAFADAIPVELVLDAMLHYSHALEDLLRSGRTLERARYLIVLGALCNRGAFEVAGLPKNANFRLP